MSILFWYNCLYEENPIHTKLYLQRPPALQLFPRAPAAPARQPLPVLLPLTPPRPPLSAQRHPKIKVRQRYLPTFKNFAKCPKDQKVCISLLDQ